MGGCILVISAELSCELVVIVLFRAWFALKNRLESASVPGCDGQKIFENIAAGC
jgi:hypothetical protein